MYIITVRRIILGELLKQRKGFFIRRGLSTNHAGLKPIWSDTAGEEVMSEYEQL